MGSFLEKAFLTVPLSLCSYSASTREAIKNAQNGISTYHPEDCTRYAHPHFYSGMVGR